MSLLTRCPACETLYKLVPDQLRISQGWVKCGQCGEIFDASKHLIQVEVEHETAGESLSESATPGDGASASPVLAVDAPDVSAIPAVISAAPSLQVELGAYVPPTHPAAEAPAFKPECAAGLVDLAGEALSATEGVLPDETQSPLNVVLEPVPPDSSASAELDPLSGEFQKDPVADEPMNGEAHAQLPVLQTEEELPRVSFLGERQRQPVWYSRGGKFVLWAAAILLTAGLFFQWLYWERAYLSASYPILRPLLQQMCQPLNCSVPALQRIDAIAIESAAFNRLNTNSYRLSFTVKNLSKLALALPGVELTLTDTHEQVIARRVFLQQEIFVANQEFMPGSELPVTVALQLDVGEANTHVSGYRLLAFYP